MILNPIVANLHNTKTDRYHPIYFREVPLPGGDQPDKPVRHKSGGHHTEGFKTRAEALQHCEEMRVELAEASGTCGVSLFDDFKWDGGELPAMVVFFAEVEGKPDHYSPMPVI